MHTSSPTSENAGPIAKRLCRVMLSLVPTKSGMNSSKPIIKWFKSISTMRFLRSRSSSPASLCRSVAGTLSFPSRSGASPGLFHGASTTLLAELFSQAHCECRGACLLPAHLEEAVLHEQSRTPYRVCRETCSAEPASPCSGNRMCQAGLVTSPGQQVRDAVHACSSLSR